jgi:hypothetical protein
VSIIIVFELEIVPMFFTWIPLKNSKVLFKVWSFATIAIITIGVKGKGNSKGEK